MKRKREFGEGPFYTVLNFVMWFFLGNLYFILTNILFIMYILAFGFNVTMQTSLIFTISLIPMGPSLVALCASMGKIVREKDINITSYYFKSYISNFKQAMFLWLVELITIFILCVDIKFFFGKSYGGFLIPVFALLIIFIVLIGLYVFPIISRFYLKSSDVIRLSLYYSIRKFNITLLHISAIVCGFILLYKLPSISMFFVASVICYFIMYYNKKIFEELEEKIADKPSGQPINMSDDGE